MSFWIATGSTRSSTNVRTVSWISRCSSLSSKSMAAEAYRPTSPCLLRPGPGPSYSID